MQAIVFTQYGSPDVLHLKEVETPTPKDNQVLVEIHATSANAGDWHLMRASPWLVRLFCGLFKPKFNILGADVAGRVAVVGKDVTQFNVGDAVYGDVSGCGFGGFAEFVAADEKTLAMKPDAISFAEAAAVPAAAVTALQALRDKGKIQAGQKVLINGASGGVGSFAVQIAKAFDTEVTAVCSTNKMAMVKSLGADHVIDYTQDDFTRNGKQYDLILAANGYQSIWAYKRALSPRGRYVMTGGKGKQMSQAMLWGIWISLFSSKKMGNMLVKPNGKDVAFLSGLIEAGKLKSVIDQRYALRDTADAIRYLEEGHAAGKVVIDVKQDVA